MSHTELADPTLDLATVDIKSSGVISVMVDAYGDDGYRRGYEGAMRNLLAALVPLAEQHLQSAPSARRNVYAFIEFLERRIERISSDAGYVTDGLGI